MHACHPSAVRTGIRMGPFIIGLRNNIYISIGAGRRDNTQSELYILSNKISWAQSRSLYLLIFLQWNLVVIKDLLGFPLCVFILRSMAQWERGTSFSLPFIDSALHFTEICLLHSFVSMSVHSPTSICSELCSTFRLRSGQDCFKCKNPRSFRIYSDLVINQFWLII